MLEKFRAHLGRNVAPPRFLMFALILVVACALARWRTGDLSVSLLIGFDIASLTFFGLISPLLNDDTRTMRHTAQMNDANRVALLAITTLICTVILIAVGTLIATKQAIHWQGLALVVSSLVLTWVFANTVFALHYAHLYYLPAANGDRRGLAFQQDQDPSYWDFLYFSFTLGMTFQTSDVTITGSHIRKVVLGHSMAAFLFNMGVLAFTVNALGGL